jgi:Ca2+-binding EF-hand superfamily protein
VHELTNEKYAVALYDWAGTKEAHMSLKKGQELNVLTTTGAWWQGYTDNGNVGCFPGNYVKLIPKRTPPKAGAAVTTATTPPKPAASTSSTTLALSSSSTSVSSSATTASTTTASSTLSTSSSNVAVVGGSSSSSSNGAAAAPPSKPSSRPPASSSTRATSSEDDSDSDNDAATPTKASSAANERELAAVYAQLAAEANSSASTATSVVGASAAGTMADATAAAAAAAEAAKAAARREALAEKLRRMLMSGDALELDTDETRIMRAFQRLDKDNDGVVTRAELARQLRRWEKSGLDVKRAADEFPGTAPLDYAAFKAGVQALERAQPRKQVVVDKVALKALFTRYDKDSVGRVDRRRLKHMLKKLDFDALGTTRSKVLRYFHTELAGTQPIEFSELLRGIEQTAFSDLDEERRQDFFRVMQGDKAGGRRKTAAAAARGAALSTNDVAELAALQLPTHRDATAASLRAAKLRAAFHAGLVRSNSAPRLRTTSHLLAPPLPHLVDATPSPSSSSTTATTTSTTTATTTSTTSSTSTSSSRRRRARANSTGSAPPQLRREVRTKR